MSLFDASNIRTIIRCIEKNYLNPVVYGWPRSVDTSSFKSSSKHVSENVKKIYILCRKINDWWKYAFYISPISDQLNVLSFVIAHRTNKRYDNINHLRLIKFNEVIPFDSEAEMDLNEMKYTCDLADDEMGIIIDSGWIPLKWFDTVIDLVYCVHDMFAVKSLKNLAMKVVEQMCSIDKLIEMGELPRHIK